MPSVCNRIDILLLSHVQFMHFPYCMACVSTSVLAAYHFMLSVRPGELVPAIAEAKSVTPATTGGGGGGGGGGETKVVRILAGAMKQLKQSRLKPDHKLNSDLVSLVRDDPQIFNNPFIIEVTGSSNVCVCVCVCVSLKNSCLEVDKMCLLYLKFGVCCVLYPGFGVSAEEGALSHFQG